MRILKTQLQAVIAAAEKLPPENARFSSNGSPPACGWSVSASAMTTSNRRCARRWSG